MALELHDDEPLARWMLLYFAKARETSEKFNELIWEREECTRLEHDAAMMFYVERAKRVNQEHNERLLEQHLMKIPQERGNEAIAA